MYNVFDWVFLIICLIKNEENMVEIVDIVNLVKCKVEVKNDLDFINF